jgi:hypothetical protein
MLGYSSKKCPIRDIPFQYKTQSVEIFQYKYSISRDNPVPNIHSIGIFQFEMLRYSSTKCSVSMDIPVQKSQSV